MRFEPSLSFAGKLDQKDPLKSFRKKFHIPRVKGKEAIYLAGNSLGLQPRAAESIINQEMKDWAKLGVEGHVHGKRPWLYYHHFFRKEVALLVGARENEVVTMSQLTVNLHLMLASFYKPTKDRSKVIIEKGAFSSDQYAISSHISLHGFAAADSLIELSPRSGEHCLRTDDIVQAIQTHGAQTALIILGGVQYYTGQRFDIATITRAGHDAGSLVAFDLAHAVGNVPLSLHDDEVDFAVWCGYKYLNGGPGAVAGAFVHERHATGSKQRLAGWWGNNERDRFQMKPDFDPMTGADGWQVSNFPVLSGAPLLASLEIFRQAGMKKLRAKSISLTGFAEFLLTNLDPDQNHFRIITPADPEERGCQLSILVTRNGKRIFDAITRESVICDWREPDVIRIAPVPLYNSFKDVWRFSEILAKAIGKTSKKRTVNS
jgi:kynureninase